MGAGVGVGMGEGVRVCRCKHAWVWLWVCMGVGVGVCGCGCGCACEQVCACMSAGVSVHGRRGVHAQVRGCACMGAGVGVHVCAWMRLAKLRHIALPCEASPHSAPITSTCLTQHEGSTCLFATLCVPRRLPGTAPHPLCTPQGLLPLHGSTRPHLRPGASPQDLHLCAPASCPLARVGPACAFHAAVPRLQARTHRANRPAWGLRCAQER